MSSRLYSLHYTAKSLQSCPTLCDPIDGSPPDFPDPGILQARVLEWVAIAFSITLYYTYWYWITIYRIKIYFIKNDNSEIFEI